MIFRQLFERESYVALMNGLVLRNPRLMDVAVPANLACGAVPSSVGSSLPCHWAEAGVGDTP
jgi:hypothetical protein